jgi:hypothetical protein
MDTYEEWTLDLIARLRADAQKASAEADTLQRTFDEWRASQALPNGAAPDQNSEEKRAPHGDAPKKRRGRKPRHGSKNAEALKLIKAAAPEGLTMDEIYKAFVDKFGPDYKRSSMRALLWNQRQATAIENRNGRFVIAAKEQPAP